MTKRRPLFLLFGGLFIILAAQVLNFVQVRASTEKALTQAQVSQKLVGARDLKLSLERGMGFGKPLALFSGMDKIFGSLKSRYDGIEFLALTSPSLEIFAQDGPPALENLSDQAIPSFPAVNDGSSKNSYKTIIKGNLVLVALPLYFNNTDLKGMAWLGFSRQPILVQLRSESTFGLRILAILITCSVLAFLALFFLTVRGHDTGVADPLATAVKKRYRFTLLTRVSLAIVLVLSTAILSYTFATNGRLTHILLRVYEKNVDILVRSQAAELKRLLDWDIAPEHWKGVETLLAAQVRNTPEAQFLVLSEPGGRVLFSADRGSTYPNAKGGPAPQLAQTGMDDSDSVRTPLADKEGKAKAFLSSKVDQAFLDSILLERFLDALTVTLVSLVFSIELLLALGLLARRSRREATAPSLHKSETGIKIIRFTAFLFFMAELLPLPFMALFISDLYAHSPFTLFAFSPDAIKGLPFSAHLLGVMVFVPTVGALSSRFSLRNLFLISGFLLLAGNLLAAFSDRLTVLILYRFLSGLGYGGVLAASNGLVVQMTTKENRTSGFAAWGAGFAAASICAVVLGGILATQVGYRNGLMVSASISILMAAFVLFYHPRKVATGVATLVRKIKITDIFAPFRDRTAVVTLFFVSIPVQLAFFGLFQYTLPIVMDQAGLSEANIGRILTIYGIISLGAPFLARYADRTRNEKRLLVLGNLVTGAFLMVFFAQSGVWAIVLVVAAIGIGGLVFDTVTSSYLSFTKASEKYGETRFLSVFLTWEKFFTVFIPVLVGSLMTVVGYVKSAAILGVVIALGATVFAIFSRSNKAAAAPGQAEGEKS